MRPPMQTKALQQHEHSRHLSQQQTTQHQVNQYQEEANVVAFTHNNINASTNFDTKVLKTNSNSNSDLNLNSKAKELIFEKNLSQQATNSPEDQKKTLADSVPSAFQTYQQKEQQSKQKHQQQKHLNYIDEDFQSVPLLDHRESLPPKLKTGVVSTSSTSVTTTIPASIATRPHSYTTSSNYSVTQRNSLSSQYSRSSSSDEASTSSLSYSSRANTFDDAAEHFIINFPSDSSHIHPHSSYSIEEDSSSNALHLPLSETEPLLTNIEATVNDSKRSICLTKNSASLVFTKKDLSKLPATSANNNSKHLLAKQIPASRKTDSSQSSLSFNESSSRKRTKHLPASYLRRLNQPHYQHQHHQLHRRSLQLNYNNNLVTTSTCCNSNNNYCCSALNNTPVKSNTIALHKRHSGQTAVVVNNSVNVVSNNKTAAATRKQHAYSWYAPVYSALEEELEQDSRESSPIHNLANSKQKSTHSQQYQNKSIYNSNSNAVTDNETAALIESRNQAKIQPTSLALNQQNPTTVGSSVGGGKRSSAQDQPIRRKSSSNSSGNSHATTPHSLILPTKGHYNGITSQRGSFGSEIQGLSVSIEEGNGLHASSLGLAGGPLPTRRRFGNFLKSLVGLRSASSSSSSSTSISNSNTTNSSSNNNGSAMVGLQLQTSNLSNTQIPRQPPPSGIPIQRPLSPEITITRTPSEQNMVFLRDPSGRSQPLSRLTSKDGSTSSLNVVQQKIKNIMRREQSANSLHHEKCPAIVECSLRKCGTVSALTNPGGEASPLSMFGNEFDSKRSSNSNILYTGSGIFSPNGIEQIRPLNRLRASATSIQAVGRTSSCSRCSSLLSLAASGSHYSLSNSFTNSNSHLQLQYIQAKVGSNSSNLLGSRCQKRLERHEQQQQQQQNEQEDQLSSTVPLKVFPHLNISKNKGSLDSLNKDVKKSSGNIYNLSSPSNLMQHQDLKLQGKKLSLNFSHSMPASELNSPSTPTCEIVKSSSSMNLENPNIPPIKEEKLEEETPTKVLFSVDETDQADVDDNTLEEQQQKNEPPFESFTCKLCLVDVEAANEATVLQQCGCRFCTECMKAYVEFEISEAAYEISCPDAQCPAQGVMTLAEISDLTTANLMKKHHRYRLNREIDLDKTRTWCPRAGCETVCNVGLGPQLSDATPSTSAYNKAQMNSNTSGNSSASSSTSSSPSPPPKSTGKEKTVVWAVQCPSCKDEFCSACKKSWHPSISCEEHGRRLVADGQDDIGIPFDNDLIKYCPMCAVPIEKDEGCAQMMCKRCKHVFCWYCLASLDDDFLLRHYDKGPCKNKLGHSRASVVWHRAQVIGIFAGFGILLLVASPLLLLAAPCIICCKCRSCSGSKIDDGEDELDEATALQS